MEILFMEVLGLVNCYSLGCALVNCYALDPTGQYSVLIFHIPTVFNIILLELARFRNFWYSISSCPTLPLSLSFSYSNVEVENSWQVFRPFSSLLLGLDLLDKIISVLLIKPIARRIRVQRGVQMHSHCGIRIVYYFARFALACRAGFVKIIWAD